MHPTTTTAPPRNSLFRSGLAIRLTLAAGLSAFVWAGIIWALGA